MSAEPRAPGVRSTERHLTRRTALACLFALAPAGLAACSQEDPPPAGPAFSLLADAIPGGVLLSAWSDGETMLAVGGNLGGGPGILARYRQGRLCVEQEVADRALWWIHGPREGEWYAVGEGGRIVHEVDGQRNREDVETEATLFGVWASGEEAWAVGGSLDDSVDGKGEVWAKRDGTWSLVAGDLPGQAFKVWEGWVVGDRACWRIEDGALTEVDAGGDRLLTVRGRNPATDVWAVGGATSAVVRHWDGVEFREVDPGPLTQPLNGVWTAPGEEVWVAGMFGTAAWYDAEGWHEPDQPLTAEHFHGVWKHQGEVLWVGGNLMSTTGEFHGTIARYGEQAGEAEVEECGSW